MYSEVRIAEQEAKKEQRISDALLQTELRISASNRSKSEKKLKLMAWEERLTINEIHHLSKTKCDK